MGDDHALGKVLPPQFHPLVRNQITETHRVLDLAKLISDITGADIAYLPNPRVEALGARDHWAVERLVGEPAIEPSLNRAIEVLRKVAAAPHAARERS